jgi:DNA-binding MarR family transcriptional regulator
MTDLNCTFYRLRKATRRITGLFDEALGKAGLTATQFTVLAMIATAGPRPMSGLAEALGMDASTLTRTLKPLLKRGDVAIVSDGDKRVKRVTLTEHGQETVALAVPHWRAAQKQVAQVLGGDITHLHDLLGTVSRMPEPAEARPGAVTPNS